MSSVRWVDVVRCGRFRCLVACCWGLCGCSVGVCEGCARACCTGRTQSWVAWGVEWLLCWSWCIPVGVPSVSSVRRVGMVGCVVSGWSVRVALVSGGLLLELMWVLGDCLRGLRASGLHGSCAVLGGMCPLWVLGGWLPVSGPSVSRSGRWSWWCVSCRLVRCGVRFVSGGLLLEVLWVLGECLRGLCTTVARLVHSLGRHVPCLGTAWVLSSEWPVCISARPVLVVACVVAACPARVAVRVCWHCFGGSVGAR